ncbi:MAG: MFS transporter [bacterium]
MVSLLNDAASEMLYPLLPLFITQKLGLSKVTLGLIEGIAEATSGVVKGVAGRLSDTVRKRKSFVVWGYLLSAVSRPLIGISEWWASIGSLRMLDRAGKGLRTSPRDAMIAQTTPSDIRGLAFGFHRSLDTVGAIIGPLFTLLFFYRFGWDFKTVFLIAAIPAGIGLFVLILGVREVTPPRRKAGEHVPLRITPRLLLLLAPLAVFSLGKFTDTLFLLRAPDMGIEKGLVPALYLIMNITYASLSTPIGAWTDRLGRIRFVPVGFMFYAIVSLGFAIARAPALAWALFALHGAYYALTEGVQRTLIADFSAAEERGTAFGIYHATVSLLQLPAGVIAGYLWDTRGGAAPFFYAGGMASAATLLFYGVFRRLSKEPAH